MLVSSIFALTFNIYTLHLLQLYNLNYDMFIFHSSLSILWPHVLEILELLTRVNFLMYLYTTPNLEVGISFFFVRVGLTLDISAVCRTQKKTSHAGIFERSDCSDDQTAKRKGTSRIQHGEEGQGCALGRKIVSDSHKWTWCCLLSLPFFSFWF